MVGPKFDPKNGHNFVKFKKNKWRVNVNGTNFRLQQRIFITKIAIAIARRTHFKHGLCLKKI